MNKKNKKYRLNYLSPEFYKRYPSEDFPEMINKDNRPYMVLLVQIEGNTFAIPLRTKVTHNNCYKFKKSSRTTDSVTGLDYSKAVIVKDRNDIGIAARIDDVEYTELDSNYHIILKQFTSFVKGYIKFAKGNSNEFMTKKYQYTTLKYFHQELLRTPEHAKLDDTICKAREGATAQQYNSFIQQQENSLDKE